MKRKAMVSLLALALVCSLHAATWHWSAEGEGVTGFRHQLDGEDPDGWTEVGSDVVSYGRDDLEGEHLLYVQQTYDGKRWGPSLVLGPDGHARTRTWKQGLDLLVGGGVNLDRVLGETWFHGSEDSLVVPDIWSWPTASLDYTGGLRPWGFGIRAGLGFGLQDPLRTYRYGLLDAHALATFSLGGEAVGLELGVGAFVMLPLADLSGGLVQELSGGDATILYGPVVEATLEIGAGSLRLLVQGSTALVLHDSFVRYGLREELKAGIGYRF